MAARGKHIGWGTATPWGTAAAGLMICALASGCVERRMLLCSNPPGAAVYVDDYPVGTTPCGVNFIYYGTRKIRLVKDGYETLTVLQDVPTPLYDLPGIDFFSENVLPGQLRDTRTFTYQLTPLRVVPAAQLMSRAEELRRGAATGNLPGGPAPPPPLGVNWSPQPAPLTVAPATLPPTQPQAVPGQFMPGPVPAGQPQPLQQQFNPAQPYSQPPFGVQPGPETVPAPPAIGEQPVRPIPPSWPGQ